MLARRFCVALLVLSVTPLVAAQRVSYPPEEFQARRAEVCKRLDGPLVLLFGDTRPTPGVRFRQDNDFFYLTGVEDLNAALLLDTSTCDAHLFLPAQSERERMVDGPNLLSEPVRAEAAGFAAVHPSTYLCESLARRRTGGPQPLYVRLSERDAVDLSRGDTAIYTARRMATPFNDQPSEDAYRVSSLREKHPYYELHDISPMLDELRTIKSSREIEVLRRNGRISAAGIRRAIEISRAGVWEYELETAAASEFLANGAEGYAFPAIVGSGPNVNIWHYQANDRRLADGDLVVMDFGASMGYLTMDITRTWPVSGRFDDLQERAYRCVLEAQKAVIAAMVPGATRDETEQICRAIYDEWGFEDQRASGAGHYVGMATHDVGDHSLPFAPGMVIAVEPIIELPQHDLHIRIEDTVLITEDGPEVLSASVPKEVDELLALVGSAR